MGVGCPEIDGEDGTVALDVKALLFRPDRHHKSGIGPVPCIIGHLDLDEVECVGCRP